MATNGGDDDDARYRAAHEPAALWHAYLARRQRENPLFLRRTLSFVPGQPTIGGPAAPAPAPDRAVGRYLRLRLPAAALSAAGAPAGARLLCATLYERRGRTLAPLEAARPVRLTAAPAAAGGSKPPASKKAAGAGSKAPASKKRKTQEEAPPGDEVWLCFDTEASAMLDGTRRACVALQVFDAAGDGAADEGAFVRWPDACTFSAATLSEKEALEQHAVTQAGLPGPLGRASHGALVDVHKTFAGDATRGILGLADAPAAARGGFEAVKLKAQRKAAGAYTVRVGAAWACAPAGATTASLAAARAVAAAPTPAPPGAPAGDAVPACVFYHLVYWDAATRALASRVSRTDAVARGVEVDFRGERRLDFSTQAACAWCGFQAGTSRALAQHLRASHSPALRFECLLDDRDRLHVVATPRAVSAAARRAGALAGDDDDDDAAPPLIVAAPPPPGVVKCCSKDQYVVRQAAAAAGAQADLPLGTPRPTAPTRQYYHARTGQPIHPRLLQSGYDSDDEVDEGWRLRRAEVLLDEFEDVTPPEKAFMKLWNRWIFARPIQADRDVPRAVVAFARAHAAEIAGQNLRHNFLLHLFHLWDNSLLAAAHISAALDVVDDEAARPTSEEP